MLSCLRTAGISSIRIEFFHKKLCGFAGVFPLKLGLSGSQQTGLVKACEMLGISDNRQDKHRALDDSVLSGQVFARIYDSEAFSRFVFCADEEFYRRLTYKTTIISDLKNEYVNLAKLKFKCCDCGNPVERVGEWCFRSRAFFADYYCAECDKKYTARVQVKLKYSGAETAKTLTQKPEPPPEEPGVSETASNIFVREILWQRSGCPKYGFPKSPYWTNLKNSLSVGTCSTLLSV